MHPLLLRREKYQGGATPGFETTNFNPVTFAHERIQLFFNPVYPDNNDFF
jgi:hypothetical protein